MRFYLLPLLTLPPTLLPSAPLRSRSACASLPPSTDASATEAACALASGLLCGKRKMSLAVSAPVLSPSSSLYQPSSLASFALECVRPLLSHLKPPGNIVLLLPGQRALREALAIKKELIEKGTEWQQEDLRRLELAELATRGTPAPDETPPAGVILAGVRFGSSDDLSARYAAAWLRTCVGVCVCINSPPPLLPFELSSARYEPVYALSFFDITREILPFPGAGGKRHFCERLWVTAEGELREPSDGAVATEELGHAVLWRCHPGPWRVLLDAASSGEYQLLAELPDRPSEAMMIEMVEPPVRARLAALQVLRGLSGDGAATANGDTRSTAALRTPGADTLKLSSLEAGRVAAVLPPGTVVSLTWAQIDADAGEGALALYQSSTLLRQRVHGRAVRFNSDEKSLHIVQPFSLHEARAARARSQGYGRLNGDVRGVCLLQIDTFGTGVASVEQLSLQRDIPPEERAACAQALFSRAAREAVERRQVTLVVPPLAPLLRVEGERWLRDAGFVPVESELAAVRPANLGDGHFFVRL